MTLSQDDWPSGQVRSLAAAPPDARKGVNGVVVGLGEFVVNGQYQARQDDLDAAAHDSEVLALVQQAQAIAQTAVQNAQLAQASAATANGYSDQATQ